MQNKHMIKVDAEYIPTIPKFELMVYTIKNYNYNMWSNRD